MKRRGSLGSVAVLAAAMAATAGHMAAPEPDGTSRPRRKHGPLNRHQECARRRRQIERGVLRVTGSEAT